METEVTALEPSVMELVCLMQTIFCMLLELFLACGGGTIAFAAACQLEDQYDRYNSLVFIVLVMQNPSFFHCRPIAGIANFCPSQVNADTDDEKLYGIAKHEVFHALVIFQLLE